MSLQIHQDESRDFEDGWKAASRNITAPSPVLTTCEPGQRCSAFTAQGDGLAHCQGTATFLLQIKEGVEIPLCGAHIPHPAPVQGCAHEWGPWAETSPWAAECVKCGRKKANPRWDALSGHAASEARAALRTSGAER